MAATSVRQSCEREFLADSRKVKIMKRNLLAGLVLALAVPAAAFAAPATQKHAVVAQANTAGATKSTNADAKGKKKVKKGKASKSAGMNSTDHKAEQAQYLSLNHL